MPHIGEPELRQRAADFIAALAPLGIEAALDPDAFRNYQAKVIISVDGRERGKVNLYYSPKKDSFSLSTHELKDPALEPHLQTAWADAPPMEGWQAYVDGSYRNGVVGYGVVILESGQVIDELWGTVPPTWRKSRQIGGELWAVLRTVEWAEQRGLDEIAIYYDYEGIEAWATGRWQANTAMGQKYAASMQACPLTLHWHKVDSHTGDRWNDHADRLARRGAAG